MPRTRRLLAVLAALLVVAAVAVWVVGRHTSDSSVAAHAPSVATPASSATTSTTSRPAATSATSRPPRTSNPARSSSGQCSASQSFVPTRFSITRLNISVPVVPVDEQSSKGTMAPPVDQPWEVAWIDTTNKPGSRSPGVIDLTAHTYHAGGAIGNSLYSTNPLRPGDVIVLSDGAGHSSCYRYTKKVKFSAATYASNSTVFYDPQSTPQVRLMICWDYNWTTRDWASRVVFYADPVR